MHVESAAEALGSEVLSSNSASVARVKDPSVFTRQVAQQCSNSAAISTTYHEVQRQTGLTRMLSQNLFQKTENVAQAGKHAVAFSRYRGYSFNLLHLVCLAKENPRRTEMSDFPRGNSNVPRSHGDLEQIVLPEQVLSCQQPQSASGYNYSTY